MSRKSPRRQQLEVTPRAKATAPPPQIARLSDAFAGFFSIAGEGLSPSQQWAVKSAFYAGAFTVSQMLKNAAGAEVLPETMQAIDQDINEVQDALLAEAMRAATGVPIQ